MRSLIDTLDWTASLQLADYSYYTSNDQDDPLSWRVVEPSPDACDTPQMLTTRLNDYMYFSFVGTGISVVGTVGIRQGIININIDGENITNVDRGRRELVCDYVLFAEEDLPYETHTVTATFVGRKKNPIT
ncbi:hypothetical protein FRB90_010150, partial [Tulasnella sp. 427]